MCVCIYADVRYHLSGPPTIQLFAAREGKWHHNIFFSLTGPSKHPFIQIDNFPAIFVVIFPLIFVMLSLKPAIGMKNHGNFCQSFCTRVCT